MVEMIPENLSRLALVAPTQTPARPVVVAVVTDAVLLTGAALKRKEAQAELTAAAQLERQADALNSQAEMAERSAESTEFEGAKAERAANDARGEATQAEAEERAADIQAQECRLEADRKQALSSQKKQEAELLKIKGEALLDDKDLANFNEGVYLLSLADSGFQAADTLKDEAVHLASNVQASLDLAKACRTRKEHKTDEAKQQKATAEQRRTVAKEQVELSERAQEAADALKLSAADRRRVAEKLLAEADVASELAELGQRVQGGFLVV